MFLNMNIVQRRILWICAILIGGMLIYPPFQLGDTLMEFAWITRGMGRINVQQLYAQWVAVIVISAIAYILAE